MYYAVFVITYKVYVCFGTHIIKIFQTTFRFNFFYKSFQIQKEFLPLSPFLLFYSQVPAVPRYFHLPLYTVERCRYLLSVICELCRNNKRSLDITLLYSVQFNCSKTNFHYAQHKLEYQDTEYCYFLLYKYLYFSFLQHKEST